MHHWTSGFVLSHIYSLLPGHHTFAFACLCCLQTAKRKQWGEKTQKYGFECRALSSSFDQQWYYRVERKDPEAKRLLFNSDPARVPAKKPFHQPRLPPVQRKRKGPPGSSSSGSAPVASKPRGVPGILRRKRRVWTYEEMKTIVMFALQHKDQGSALRDLSSQGLSLPSSNLQRYVCVHAGMGTCSTSD